MRRVAVVLALVLMVLMALPVLGAPVAASRFPGRDDPSDRLGTTAPPLALGQWVQGGPLEIDELRGRVVLLRWWTDTCPFCASSAPALRSLHETYGERGLTVIGVFHPKPAGDDRPERVRRAAKRFGFEFPLALDPEWKALRRWWLDHGHRWTSVTFLVDRRGVIRYVHPGGEFHDGDGGSHWPDHASCNRERREIEARIAELLAEEDGGVRE